MCVLETKIDQLQGHLGRWSGRSAVEILVSEAKQFQFAALLCYLTFPYVPGLAKRLYQHAEKEISLKKEIT